MQGHTFFDSDGQHYRRTADGRLFRLDRFDYVLNATVGANATLRDQALNLDGDYDFELHEIVGSRTSALLTIEMADSTDAGKRFQSAAVNIDNWLGTAQLPFVLIPQFWQRRKNLTFTFVDTSGAPNVVQLVFRGYKLVSMARRVAA